METRRLASFVQIVDSGSLTRAASIVGVAQPALSQQLSDLEHHFGTQLLIRHHSGVSPTPAGLKLYRHSQTILRQLDVAMQDIADDLSGTVRIGSVTSIVSHFLVPLLKQLKTNFPSLNFVFLEDKTTSLLDKLENRTLDIGIAFLTQSVPGIVSIPIVTEPLFLVSSTESSVSFDGESASGAELAKLPLVLPTTGTLNRMLIDQAFASYGINPNVIAEVDSLSGLSAVVNANMAFTILPALVAQGHWPGIRFRALPGLERTVSICVSESSVLVPSIEAVKNYLMSFFMEMVAGGEWPSARLAG